MSKSQEVKKVGIYTEYLKLQQFLKLAGVVGQGSDAKMLILDEQVKVNGQVSTERGKKIRVNDIVEVNAFGKYIAVVKND